MIGKRLDIVLVKLCAVIIVVLALQTAAGFVSFYVDAPEARFSAITAFVLNFMVPIIIATALWFFPATILGSVPDNSSDSSIEPDWVVASVTLIGLYVLVFGVIDLAFYETFWVAEKVVLDPDDLGIYALSPETIAGRVTNIIQIVIGLILLIGKRRIAGLVRPT